MKILKSTDRVKVKIGDIALIISPLKQSQKLVLSGMTKIVDGHEVQDIGAMVSYIVKNCVRGVEGVTDFNDEPITLTFNQDGSMDDDSHSMMMVVVSKAKSHFEALFKVAANEHPGQIKDLITGEVVSGAEVTVLPKT